MTRYHNDSRSMASARPIERPRNDVPDGKVRCPACESVAALTRAGWLWPHRTPRGEECPQRLTGDAPKVVLDEPLPVPALEAPSGLRLSPNGTCHECGRPVSGERRYCGRCAARRSR